MAHLSIGVLGSMQVRIDEMPVTLLESDKVSALLVYLSVEADRPHRRESLAGLLWPDYPEQVARHNLRQALFNLRQAIGDHKANPPYLLISREAIQFNRTSDFSLDFDHFNPIFQTREADRNQGGEDPSIRAARLEEMVQLYRGEFMQGFTLEDCSRFEEWVLVQRESLHQYVMDACSDLADYYELCGNFSATRRHALRQLELDPWREEAHRQLMRALALDGQRSAALAQYETCRRILAEELGVEPSANTRELVDQIRSEKLKPEGKTPTPIPTASIHKLPIPLTSFLGREQELEELDKLITNPECRCISLVGPGGIGKTRLALRTGEQHKDTFVDGVAFIPLAPVGTVEAAISAIASAIHIFFYDQNDPKIQLLNYLREKQMLLILDNVEQLLIEGPLQEDFVELVLEILQHAPRVKLLVTSREVLNLQEEWIFEVRGLAFPATDQTEKTYEYDAVSLFIQRARRVSPGLASNGQDLAEIAHICRLVEGMPLAIELSATWLRILSTAEIAKEIEGSLDVLSASVRDLPERHRNMRVVFDGSWQKLSAKEQQVLSQLSVFRGGFSRQAAEQVAGASLPVLSTLVNRTLIRRTADGRYHLHVLVRQYAEQKLSEDPVKQERVKDRYATYYVHFLAEWEKALKGSRQSETFIEMGQMINNLSRGWQQMVTSFGLQTLKNGQFRPDLFHRSLFSLSLFYEMHHRSMEAVTLFKESVAYIKSMQDVFEKTEDCTTFYSILGHLTAYLGLHHLYLPESEQGRAYLKEAIQLLEKGKSRLIKAQVQVMLGTAYALQGQLQKCAALLEESREVFREYDDRWWYLLSIINVVPGYISRRKLDESEALLEEGLELLEPGDLRLGMPLRVHYAYLLNLKKEFAKAERVMQESLRLSHQYGSQAIFVQTAATLFELGRLALNTQRIELAKEYFQKAINTLMEAGQLPDHARMYLGKCFVAQQDLSAARDQFLQVIKIGQDLEKPHMVYWGLVSIAKIYKDEGQAEKALEISLALRHFNLQYIKIKEEGDRLLADLHAELPQWQVDAIMEQVDRKVSPDPSDANALAYALEQVNEPMRNVIEEAGGEKNRPGKVPQPDSRLIEPISKREIEVLILLSQGFSNKEIAKSLIIACDTVHKHLKNIYGKLGVHSRTEAIARARELEIL